MARTKTTGVNIKAFEELVEKFDRINKIIQSGKKLPHELTKNFVSFPLSNDLYNLKTITMQKFIQHDVQYHLYKSNFDGTNTTITAILKDMDHKVIMDVIKNEHYKITGYFKNNQLGNIIVLESQDVYSDDFHDHLEEIKTDIENIEYAEYNAEKEFNTPLFDNNLSKHADEKEEYEATESKTIKQAHIPSIKITSNTSFIKRLWNFLKNPFTYIFYGTIEY